MKIITLSMTDVAHLSKMLLARIVNDRCIKVYGVPRGGVAVALSLQHSPFVTVVNCAEDADVIVDDIIASGATKARYAHTGKVFDALLRQEDCEEGAWYVFPWEGDVKGSQEDIVIRQLQAIGEDPTRNGLIDTPQRVIKSWGELFGGYKMNHAEILSRQFTNEERYDQMILLKGVEFFSCCEHHLLPFFGRVSIAYIPSETGGVVGISKLARLVECFSRRAQIQERMTKQIADAVVECLQPLGVGVVVEAQHLCMIARGVKQGEAVMQTSALEGVFRKPETRAEFFTLLK